MAPEAGLKFTYFNTETDIVEITNFGDETWDISSYRFCSFPAYSTVAQQNVLEGDIANFAPGDVLRIELTGSMEFGAFTAGDSEALALYESFQYTDPTTMFDFVEYGAAGDTREGVAIQAGLWLSNDPIMDESTEYWRVDDLEMVGSEAWTTERGMSGPVVRFTYVEPETQEVTLTNFGDEGVDISTYQLCNFPAYDPMDIFAVVDGSFELGPGESVTFVLSGAYTLDPPSAANQELGLYIGGPFGSADNMVDYFAISTGTATGTRENVAVEAGLWISGDLIDFEGPYERDEDLSVIGEAAWSQDSDDEGIEADIELLGQTCADGIVLSAEGLTAGATIAILYGPNEGDNTIPASAQACGGSDIGLGAGYDFMINSADANGGFEMTFSSLPASVCGFFVQILDVATCEVSDVVQL